MKLLKLCIKYLAETRAEIQWAIDAEKRAIAAGDVIEAQAARQHRFWMMRSARGWKDKCREFSARGFVS